MIIKILNFLFISISVYATPLQVVEKSVGSLTIPFVYRADTTDKLYTAKVDFAEIEKKAPLKISNLNQLGPEDLRSLDLEEFNQIYARLSSGPMPLGDYQGFILQKTQIYESIKKRLQKQFFSVDILVKIANQVCRGQREDCLLELIWKGKRFHKKNDFDQILAETTMNLASSGFKLPSLLPDFLKSEKIDQALDLAEGLIDRASLTFFPMNTYCGVSQVDTRRESIITDATFPEDFTSYVKFRDDVVSRKNLSITEEYRMLRPGLYIGKVYSNKLFLFNVALRKTGSATSSEAANECLDKLN